MEHFGPPGPEMDHFGPSGGPDMQPFGGQPPLGDGSTGLPSLLDIQVPPPQPGQHLKRGREHLDGDFPGSEPTPPNQFGPPPEKMPPNYGPGNDMWSGENPPPPPLGPGRGGPPFRGGPGRGVPRGRGGRGR